MEAEEFDKLMRGKSINFLVGSGASVPLYPSLSFGKDYPTFEEVVSDKKVTEQAKGFMYIFYFINWIKPMSEMLNSCKRDGAYSEVFNNYKKLIGAFYNYLRSESNESPKRINIFTTNYDLLFEKAFDEYIYENPLIYFNDGSRGVFKRYISNKNFYLNITHSGYNDNYKREVPTVNLFKLHGSLSWELDNDRIFVIEHNLNVTEVSSIISEMNIDFGTIENIINKSKSKDLTKFVDKLNELVAELNLDESLINRFFSCYSKIPIINPNKFKFFETVSEQHYYQLIRSFSYELEKKQSILIVFGFSFADEHLRDIFERSLLNPELQVFLISYFKEEQDKLKNIFGGYKNIKFLPEDFQKEQGDFRYLLSVLGENDE